MLSVCEFGRCRFSMRTAYSVRSQRRPTKKNPANGAHFSVNQWACMQGDMPNRTSSLAAGRIGDLCKILHEHRLESPHPPIRRSPRQPHWRFRPSPPKTLSLGAREVVGAVWYAGTGSRISASRFKRQSEFHRFFGR